MINSSIFGKFIQREPNAINRNFRTHGFTQKKSSLLMRKKVPKKFQFDNVPDPKNWFQRECEGFSKSISENEALSLPHHRLIPKIRLENRITEQILINKDDIKSNNTSCTKLNESNKSNQNVVHIWMYL